MRVVTTDQIRELDRRAIEEAGVPGVVLMENAGRAVVEVMEKEFGSLAGKNIAVFCGSGNNGGDGFVIARHLYLSGAEVWLHTFGDEEKRKPDAQVHFNLIPVWIPTETREEWHSGSFHSQMCSYDFAVDALLGTGIRNAPDDEYLRGIQMLNAMERPVVSVDIPSGVNADTGAIPGEAVRATHTVTFAYPKLGLLLFPGAAHVGKLHVSDIGFYWPSLKPKTDIFLLGCGIKNPTAGITASCTLREPESLDEVDGWEKLLQKRAPESNKGDYGHVGVLAGSRGMVGAPGLVARAAQRVGSGLVTVLTSASAQPILAGKLDEQMTLPLPEADGAVSEAAWDKISEFAKKATVLCIGPGLTMSPETVKLIGRILQELELPIVLDADGLNALALQPGIIEQRTKNSDSILILTPHPGEAARLLGSTIEEVQADRVKSVRELARRYDAVAVLKGRHTLIANPEGQVYINTSGNPGMATGGMGDTLTGIIGGILAQNVAGAKRAQSGKRESRTSALDSATLGVHLHGVAGDMVAAAKGERGLTAGDVIEYLPAALRLLEGES